MKGESDLPFFFVSAVKNLSINWHQGDRRIRRGQETAMEDMKKERKQINIRLETELHDFLAEYAKENYKTVTAVVREMIAALYRQHQAAQKTADER